MRHRYVALKEHLPLLRYDLFRAIHDYIGDIHDLLNLLCRSRAEDSPDGPIGKHIREPLDGKAYDKRETRFRAS